MYGSTRFSTKRRVFFLLSLIILFTLGFFAHKKIKDVFASTSPWTQTDWSGGTSASLVTSTVTTYSSASDVNVSTAGQISLAETSGWAGDYSSWSKRKALTVTNSGSEQTNYQTKIDITYDSDMQADFDDLRFTNSAGTALDYWIQTYTSSTSAIVWVEIDTLSGSGDTTIYMYYGNSGASAGSNGENTFLLFDDFSGASVDDSKWAETDQAGGDEITVSDGKLKFSRASNDAWDKIVYSDTSFSRADLSFEMDYTWESANSGYDALMMGWKDDGSGISYTNMVYAFYNSGTGSGTSVSMNVYEDSGNRGGVSGTWYSQQDGGGGEDYYIRVRMRESGGAYYEYSTDAGETFSTAYTSSYSTESNLRPGWTFYSGTHHFDNARVRKWLSTEPSVSTGSEVSKFTGASGTLVSNIFNAEFAADWETITYTTSGSGSITVKVRSDSSNDMSGATDWSSCSAITSGTTLADNGCVTDEDQYLQYQITLTPSGASSPVFEDISMSFSASDQVEPTTQASSPIMYTANGGTQIDSYETDNDSWTGDSTPYFTWTAGADNDGGSGLLGYCLYLGTSSSGNPKTSKGILGTSPQSTSGTDCSGGFIITTNSIDLSTESYQGGSWFTADGDYYLIITAIDVSGNAKSSPYASFHFQFDGTAPTNVSYISSPSLNFGAVSDMSFSWPSSGGAISSDASSGVLGWQYQINGVDGTWKGTSTHALGFDYIPSDGSTFSYDLTDGDDGADISVGTNTIYFRTVDNAGNFSAANTYRTAPLEYAGEAPAFDISCGSSVGITVSPSTSTSNSFALSWDSATPADGRTISTYYYMVNTSPPSTLATLESNTSLYLTNATTSVSAKSLVGAVKGSNTVYVVAVDDSDNYSQSNCLKGTFTLNSTLPDPVSSLAVSDTSIKSEEIWRASLSWNAPSYKGTGSLTYKIQRSTDNSTWSDVGTTQGLSYTDTPASSTLYYYRVGAYDTTAESQNSPTYATSVSITPKGTYTEAPSLSGDPTVSGLTTKRATISWSTSRTSDSKVQYGKSSGDYFDEEPSKSEQVTSHEIALTNLDPGTKYYYRTKWTDEDGNTGISDELTFKTDPAPVVSEVTVSSVSVSSAKLTFTTSNANSATINYGLTTQYGGVTTLSTSTSESTYSVLLDGLADDSGYNFNIVLEDIEADEYPSDNYTFKTLPRPRIENITIQQVRNTAQPAVLVSWNTNTDISSVVTYYPSGRAGDALDVIDLSLTAGAHQAILRGLLPNTPYSMVVSGSDKVGNEAVSDVQSFTTSTDTRPPLISQVNVEGNINPVVGNAGQDAKAQLVVTWKTDEPSTSQVEFGEGTGTSYSQTTQRDGNLTFDHLVIIPNLTPSKVYHLRVVSEDDGNNVSKSVDTVTITPKGVDNPLDLVITNLSEVFRFVNVN